MALSDNALCTVEEVTAMLKNANPDPLEVEAAIEAASDAIHTFTKREFHSSDQPVERVFNEAVYASEGALSGWLLLTGDVWDIYSVNDAGVDPSLDDPSGPHEPSNVSFRTIPLNVKPDHPFLGLLLAAAPVGEITVKAKWGWKAVPDDINYACRQQAAAWYVLDSARQSDSWANELGPTGTTTRSPRSLMYGVKDTIRPYRFPSLA